MSTPGPADLRVVSNKVDTMRFDGVNVSNMLSGFGIGLDKPPLNVTPAVAAQLRTTAGKVAPVRGAGTELPGVTRTAQADTRYRPPVAGAGVTASPVLVDGPTVPKAPPPTIKRPTRDF